MKKVITDKKRIDEVLTRGVEKIYPNKESFEKVLLSGKRISLYCGFDPSAESLHIGNAIQLNKLSQFQELGHDVIFLIGDFTGMIGDPTDKSAARKKMTRKEVLANSKLYKEQAGAYLDFGGDNPARVLYNSQWSDSLSFSGLIDLASNFTAQQTLARDMFKKRLAAGKDLFLHEFLYPMMQAYDSVCMDVDLEIGGNDQMFNMLAGRTLMKKMKNKEKFVMTTGLLVDPGGKKMGKSEGNAVFMNEDPENIYGQVMSWPDGVIGMAFELCTKVPMLEARLIREQLKGGKVNPRDLKMKLAFEITKIMRGEELANQAQDYFIKTIQKKQAPKEVKSIKLKAKSINVVDLLVKANLASSKGQARRLIQQNGIKIEGRIIDDVNEQIDIKKTGILAQRGKRQFIKVFAS
ncbi:MAG: tyrosine--tRNA ligase [Patescibacteria group bacterium]|nr:tyrosine--tRNA ligase [Patescibacteria group bacterium]